MDRTETRARGATPGGLLCLLGVAVQILGGAAWGQTASSGICGRTPQVQTAILEQIDGVSDCAAVTEEQLAAIRRLGLQQKGISSLLGGDFAGLTSLRRLDLDSNALVTLPSGLFHGLTSLQVLDLAHNDLAALPSDLFRDLTALRTLDLSSNDLEVLPADLFHGLTALESLHLHFNPGYPLFEPTTTIAEGPGTAVPITSGLDPGFPNPFNSTTRIPYRLAASGPVRLTIHAVSGQPVRTLVDGVQASGRHEVSWDSRDQEGVPVAAGVYLTCLHYPGGRQVRPLLLVK